MKYLHWEVQKYGQSRSISYTLKEMRQRLESIGCIVTPHTIKFLINVYYPIEQELTEAHIASCKRNVIDNISRVHKKAARVFKGIKDNIE